MDQRFIQLSPDRFVIRDLELLRRTIPKYLGQNFAWDVETTGLDPMTDRILGLALTFENGKSFYICLEHTVPEGTISTVHEEYQVEDGFIEEPVLTKSGKQSYFKTGEPKMKKSKIYKTATHPVVYDERTFPSVTYITADDFARTVQPLFHQPTVTMVAHNQKFDIHFTSRIGLDLFGGLADTMLAAQLLNENRVDGVGLKSLATTELAVEMTGFTHLERYPGFSKEEFLGVPLEIGADYAMRDTETTLKLFELYRPRLAEEGLEYAFYDLWMPLSVTLQQMEAKGIALDMELVHKIRDEYAIKARIAEHKVWLEGIQMVIGRYNASKEEFIADGKYLEIATKIDPGADLDSDYLEVGGITLPLIKQGGTKLPRIPWFKVGSNDHIADLLYTHHNISPPKGVRLKRSANGNYSVDANTLKTLSFHYAENTPQVLKNILDYRKVMKMLSTYLDNFIKLGDKDPDHAIRTSFNLHVVDTGRLSSSSPNLQNITSKGDEGKVMRQMFVARPGHKLVVADYSNMELRLTAHYSNDPALLKAFGEGMDLHLLTAAGQAEMSYEDLKALYDAGDPEAKRKRSVGKTTNFGVLYGSGPDTFRQLVLVQNSINIPKDEAAALIRAFGETYAGATAWKEEVYRRINKRGYVMAISGRRRRLPEIWSDNRFEVARAQRQGANYVIQGSAADIVAEVMPILQAQLRPYSAYLLLQVHDEIVSESPVEHAETVARIMEKVMMDTINHRLRCPMLVEAGIGDNWGDAKH